MSRLASFLALMALFVTAPAPAQDVVGGWRGNGTGIWKEGSPPLTWHRTPKGACEGLRAQVDRPAGKEPGEAAVVVKGQIPKWLVLGPFAVKDSKAEFDHDPLGGEGEVRPSSGERLAEREWKVATIRPDDPDVFGEAEAPFLRLDKTIGLAQHQLGYAHTWLYSPRGGKARVVADHSWGLKAWVNGREVFRRVDRQAILGGYAFLSRIELEHFTDASSRFDVTLDAGWNRLLVKVSTPGANGHQEMIVNLRISDPADVAYESENIAWMAELPSRSTSTPIIVGDRLLVMCEPDQLVCLDKTTGKQLWSAWINHYAALTADERKAQPAYAERVDPLVAELKAEQDPVAREKLRAKIEQVLAEIDAGRFKIPFDGHFASHFGIVGYTMPTPISDGKHIYIWSGQGIAACFDLDGRKQWMTPVRSGDLTYASAPALADGVFVVFLNILFGIDAKTGEVLWEQPRVNKNVAGLLSAKIAGQNVVVTQEGEIVRPKDGKLIYRPKGIVKNDTGWTPGVVLGDLFYLPKYGIKHLGVLDFTGVEGENWEPKIVATMETPGELNYRPDGKSWLDRSTAAGPLVAGRYCYMIDMYAELCVYDLEAKKVVHHRKLDLAGFTHYNALAITASPALIGDHLVILDNQGTALVLTQGPEPKVVHRNVIATQLDRRIPLPAQETLAYAPPIVDGNRLYLRGERYLYCIGK